jgi:hypothetical protein
MGAGPAAGARRRQDLTHTSSQAGRAGAVLRLDPGHLEQSHRKAPSISGAPDPRGGSSYTDLAPVDLIVKGCVAVGEDCAWLGIPAGFCRLKVPALHSG